MSNYKFKVGDIVQVIDVYSEDNKDVVGMIGKIEEVDENWDYPYYINFGNGISFQQELFSADELVLYEDSNESQRKEYIDIKFQKGAIKEVGVNGCQTEDVINLLIDRLNEFQNSDLSCRENALAITKLEEARLWLEERTRKRVKQGVKGYSVKHV